MKRSALLLPPLILLPLALAAPSLAAAWQDGNVSIQTEPLQDGEEEFVWPDFIEADPLPGRYRATFTIEDMSFPGLDGGKEERAIAEGIQSGMAPEISYICLSGPPDRAVWAEEFGSDNCTTRESRIDGSHFDVVLQCNDATGTGTMNGRFSGTAGEQGLDMLMDMRIREGGAGKMKMAMRIQLERVGECE